MTVETWIAFCFATTILTLIPGPIVLYLVAHTINHSRKETIFALLGVIVGDAVLIILSFLGLGALLLTSSLAFSILKWIGALYLIYLGLKQIHTSREVADAIELNHQGKSFTYGFFVALLNPKTIVFFISFFPQFVNSNEPVSGQFFILFWSFLGFVTVTLFGYISLTESARGLFASERFNTYLSRISGCTTISAGIWAGLSRSE